MTSNPTIAVATDKKPRTDTAVGTFSAPMAEWWRAIGFFLTLALLGLRFYPAALLLLVLLVWRYRTDRYAFMLELMITIGGFGFMHSDVMPVKLTDLALIAAAGGVALYRRSPLVSRLLWLTLAYFAAIFIIATTSDEAIRVQVVMMRNYFMFIIFIVPMMMFGNHRFEWDRFIHTLFLHELVICGLYAVDTFIINGLVLVPAASHIQDAFGHRIYSSIQWIIWRPNPFWWPRHYPYGLYWMALCVIPLIRRQVRLSAGQWALVLLALFSCRTMTFLAGLLVCFICFRGKLRQSLMVGFVTLVSITGLYFVDSALGSPMRIASTIDQFTSLEAAADNEDLAEFGSGRMAQIIPKWELLGDLHRYWLGLGFLHPTLTTNPKFQIKNEYYVDASKADEVATEVEVTQFQTVLDCGFLGLLLQTGFYVGVYFIIRRLRHADVYLCVLVAISVFGIGGFAGLSQRDGLLLLATTLAAILLSNPEGRAIPENDLKPLKTI